MSNFSEIRNGWLEAVSQFQGSVGFQVAFLDGYIEPAVQGLNYQVSLIKISNFNPVVGSRLYDG